MRLQQYSTALLGSLLCSLMSSLIFTATAQTLNQSSQSLSAKDLIELANKKIVHGDIKGEIATYREAVKVDPNYQRGEASQLCKKPICRATR